MYMRNILFAAVLSWRGHIIFAILICDAIGLVGKLRLLKKRAKEKDYQFFCRIF